MMQHLKSSSGKIVSCAIHESVKWERKRSLFTIGAPGEKTTMREIHSITRFLAGRFVNFNLYACSVV